MATKIWTSAAKNHRHYYIFIISKLNVEGVVESALFLAGKIQKKTNFLPITNVSWNYHNSMKRSLQLRKFVFF